MKQYKGKVLKAMMMLLAVSFALVGTSTLSSCSSDDDPFFTVSEDDNPRILNTNLADQKLGRKTKLNLEIKVTPAHYTTVTWLLDGTQIYEGTTIDQTLPLGNHELKIVATTTKGKSTSRTLNVTVIPAADDPALGTNAIELWVAPGAETTIHNCKNLGTVTKVMVGGKEVAFEVLEEGTALKLTAPADLENGDYAITLVDGDGVEFPGGTIKVTTEPRLRPALGTNAIELWVAPGAETTIHNCKNLGTVTKVMVGGKEVAFEVLEEGTALKLTAPTGLENGDYDITLVDGAGNQFPCGKIKVTTEPRPSMETTLWEGEFAVTWGTPFEALKETFLSKVKAGTILRVYVDGKGQGTATTASWNNILTGKGGDIERGDIMVDGPAKWEFVLTDLSIQLLKEQWGLILVGNGYTVKKVTIE
nr:hypothetical protein [uncultured Prevotella sp.]